MARRRRSQVRKFISCFRAFWIEDRADGGYELRPAIAFVQELYLALWRQPVKLRALVGVRRLPVAFHPALLFKTMQRGIERSSLDLQGLGGFGANGLPD